MKKKISLMIKLNINSSIKVLSSNIISILGQRRIEASSFLQFFKHQVKKLNIKENITLSVFILVYTFNDYVVNIRIPTLSVLLKRVLLLKKKEHLFNKPGYLCTYLSRKKKVSRSVLTPYLLYELINYKYQFEYNKTLLISTYYKIQVRSLLSKGLHIYIC